MSARETVSAFLASATRRQIVLASLYGAGAGIIGGVLGAIGFALAGSMFDERLLLIVDGIAGGLLGTALAGLIAARRSSAAEVERRAPECRNLVLTASEIIAVPDRSKPYVTELVTSQAASAIARLSLDKLFPVRRALTAVGVAAALWIASLSLIAARGPDAAPFIASLAPDHDGIASIEVLVTPLAYTGRKPERLTNPARIEAMVGSRIRVTVRGDSIRAETVEGELTPIAGAPNIFETVAQSDGFIAIRAGTSTRRLIGLSVTPDQNPRVKVTAPGKDMFLADAKRRIPVEIEALDDLALTSLKLRYTRVSGSGERFTFIEGEVPVTITRTSERDWRAKGTLDLATLDLQQGDMLVYRGAATDGRPGNAATESDAFLIEITSPGAIAAEGFSLDDQQDKYALSQQMVILKTERLIARMPTMSPESVTYHSQLIAAEQRSVRAEFVFMMGGEVAEEVIAAAGITDIDETHEAESEGELAAGRMVNRGRIALVDAIRLMSRASARLNDTDPRSALPVEKAALTSLQEAFSRTRYLLRALTLRERLDLSRRLTGVLELAARDTRPAAVTLPDPSIVSLRRALVGIATLAGEATIATSSAPAATAIAQQVLSVDPSDTTLQRVSATLEDASRAIRESREDESRHALDDAATLLTTALRTRLPREDARAESPELRQLRGALSDALRRGGTR